MITAPLFLSLLLAWPANLSAANPSSDHSKLLSPTQSSRAPVTSISFSPDNSSLAATGHRSVSIYSAETGQWLESLPCPMPKILGVSFDPTGKFLAISGGDPGLNGQVQWRSMPKGDLLAQWTNHSDLVTAMAFSPNGKFFAWTSADHSVSILSPPHVTNTSPQILKGHSGPVLSLAFSPDSQLLVTTSADRSLKVWDVMHHKLIRSFTHHTATVHDVAFRPLLSNAPHTPAYCATASDDRTVRVWQPSLGRMVRIVRQHLGPAFAVEFARDGSHLFSAGQEGLIRVIDAESDQILRSWKAHDDWIYSLALSPNGKVLASGDWTGHVKLWRTNDFK